MDEMKKCPFCGEMIRSEAIKCRFCHEMLTASPASDENEGARVSNDEPNEPNANTKPSATPPPANVQANEQNRNTGSTAAPPPPYGQTIVMQRDPNEGKKIANVTAVFLILAIIIQAVFSIIPFFGPVLGAIFYGPLYLTAFILCIVCICKNQAVSGCLGLVAIVVMPTILMICMPFVLTLAGDSPRKSTSRIPQSTSKPRPAQVVVEAPVESLQTLKQKAKSGDADAQYELGCKYWKTAEAIKPIGWATDREKKENLTDAVIWLQQAADQGHVKALETLGYFHKEGIYYSKNEYYSWKFYYIAAKKGSDSAKEILKDIDLDSESLGMAAKIYNFPEAQYELGMSYLKGTKGKKQDFVSAMEWLVKAADQNYSDAKKELVSQVAEIRKNAGDGIAYYQNMLGDCYFNGHGVEVNKTEAAKWYRKAADQGYHSAEYQLGVCYENGWGVSKNLEEAASWYRKASAQKDGTADSALRTIELKLEKEQLTKNAGNGDKEAQYKIGLDYYFNQKSYPDAVKWFRLSAEQDYGPAQYRLGRCYHNGRAGKKDYAEALKWYRKAADHDVDLAKYYIGNCYYYGNGVTKDTTEAEKWFKKALAGIRKDAEAGDLESQNVLGFYYDTGIGGVKTDYSEAVKWYTKAAEKGYADAQYNMGHVYAKGRGNYIRVNYDKALEWFLKGAEQGDINSINGVGACYQNGKNNIKEAVKWFRKAADMGDETAKNNLKKLGY